MPMEQMQELLEVLCPLMATGQKPPCVRTQVHCSEDHAAGVVSRDRQSRLAVHRRQDRRRRASERGCPLCHEEGRVRSPQWPLSVFAWVKGGAPGQVIRSQAPGAVSTDGNLPHAGVVWAGAKRIFYADTVEVARDPEMS